MSHGARDGSPRLRHPRALATTFPELARYIASLPVGLRSYPAHQGKASMVRGVLDRYPLAARGDALPRELREIARDPPPVNVWMKKALANATLVAIYDLYFSSLEAFRAFVYRAQRELFESPMYAPAMRAISPRQFIRYAARRFRHFHRATELRLEPKDARAATIVLHAPPGLYENLNLTALEEGFRAGLELAGSRVRSLERRARSATETSITYEWS